MKDKTLAEYFETVLYTAGVNNSGELAEALVEAYEDWVTNVFPSLAVKALDSMDEGDKVIRVRLSGS
ncbi:MAG: hypothetical protein HRT63_12560 [Erythrobacter sp.]|nr:hypothetical protein [Erythrobacter sp.]